MNADNVEDVTAGYGDRGLPAAVVVSTEDGETIYAMFQAYSLSTEGAFLEGPFLLELNEEFVLELSISETTQIRVTARVVSLTIGPRSGVAIALNDVSRDVCELIETYAGTTGE